jgi:hypothetical protein
MAPISQQAGGGGGFGGGGGQPSKKGIPSHLKLKGSPNPQVALLSNQLVDQTHVRLGARVAGRSTNST